MSVLVLSRVWQKQRRIVARYASTCCYLDCEAGRSDNGGKALKSHQLGRLEKVDLHKEFSSEAGDFTPWLAQNENLKLLGEAIGLDLELEAREKDVGPFRADLLCKDTANDSWVLIENQFGRTDHVHLGQILTYTAGLEAVTVIWIAEKFTEEHRAALDWLNERTDDEINFFGLEIELWKIGDSGAAPKFNMISKPNDWTRSVQQAAEGSLTENKRIQLAFWIAFREYMEEHSSIRCSKPAPQYWMSHPLGVSGFSLTSVASHYNSETNQYAPEIRVELTITGKNSKQNFVALQKGHEEIEQAISLPLKWHNREEEIQCRIYTRKEDDFRDSSLWMRQHEWLQKTLETFQRVFGPIIKSLEQG